MNEIVTLTELRAALSSKKLSSFPEAQQHFQGKVLPPMIWQMATGIPVSQPTVKEGSKVVQVARLLESQPWLTRQDVESRLGFQIPKDTFNRAQVYIGGVNAFQKSLVNSYKFAVGKLLGQGVPFEKIEPADIKRVAPGIEGCRYHAVIMSSLVFKVSLSVGFLENLADSAPQKATPPVVEAPLALPQEPASYRVVGMMPIPVGYFAEIQVNGDGSKVVVVKEKIG